MRYRISHTTQYTYSQPVFLQHHEVRLTPRSDGNQILHQFDIQVEPKPQLQSPIVELDGNATVGLWFTNSATSRLVIKTTAEVETTCTNPFNYFTPSWANPLPIDYRPFWLPHCILTELSMISPLHPTWWNLPMGSCMRSIISSVHF